MPAFAGGSSVVQSRQIAEVVLCFRARQFHDETDRPSSCVDGEIVEANRSPLECLPAVLRFTPLHSLRPAMS